MNDSNDLLSCYKELGWYCLSHIDCHSFIFSSLSSFWPSRNAPAFQCNLSSEEVTKLMLGPVRVLTQSIDCTAFCVSTTVNWHTISSASFPPSLRPPPPGLSLTAEPQDQARGRLSHLSNCLSLSSLLPSFFNLKHIHSHKACILSPLRIVLHFACQETAGWASWVLWVQMYPSVSVDLSTCKQLLI